MSDEALVGSEQPVVAEGRKTLSTTIVFEFKHVKVELESCFDDRVPGVGIETVVIVEDWASLGIGHCQEHIIADNVILRVVMLCAQVEEGVGESGGVER